MPRFGDEDGGFALRLAADSIPSLSRHLALVSAVLGEAPPENAADDLPAAWLRGGAAPSRPAIRSSPRDLYAPHGGVVVLRRGRLRLTMDVGPLGHLSFAAHGHADALAVTVARDGHDVIGDPGTGSYYAEPSWRPAFRGTRMHATAAVDDSISRCRAARSSGCVTRCDRPFRRSPERCGGRGTRWLHPSGAAGYPSEMVDRACRRGDDSCRGRLHRNRQASHTHRMASPSPPRRGRRRRGAPHHRGGLADNARRLRRTVSLTSWSVRGDETSGLGWWSERFEAREPAWLIGAVTEGAVDVPVAFATLLTKGEVDPPTQASVALEADNVLVKWCEEGKRREVTVGLDRPGSVAHRFVSGGS